MYICAYVWTQGQDHRNKSKAITKHKRWAAASFFKEEKQKHEEEKKTWKQMEEPRRHVKPQPASC